MMVKPSAEDIYQLVTQLGFKSIYLVGHDIESFIVYPYAAEHPSEVRRLVVMEVPPPITNFFPPPSVNILTAFWWILFHQTPDVPEVLTQGKEKEYLSWFYQNLAYNPAAITQELSTNMLTIILLQAECVRDLSIIGLFLRTQFKMKIILRLTLQCPYWR